MLISIGLSRNLNSSTHHYGPLAPLAESGVSHTGHSVVELTLHDSPEVIMIIMMIDIDDGHIPPEVVEAGEVSPLPGRAQDPEDVLGAVQVDQQAQAVVRLLSGKVRGIKYEVLYNLFLVLPQA